MLSAHENRDKYLMIGSHLISKHCYFMCRKSLINNNFLLSTQKQVKLYPSKCKLILWQYEIENISPNLKNRVEILSETGRGKIEEGGGWQ